MPESYTLADFSKPDWMDRDEYRDWQGIGIEHIRALHARCEEHKFGESIAFLDTEGLRFEIWIYALITWTQENEIRSVIPSFWVMGTTFDGVREVQASVDSAPMPEEIIEQMTWVLKFCEDRGWKEE